MDGCMYVCTCIWVDGYFHLCSRTSEFQISVYAKSALADLSREPPDTMVDPTAMCCCVTVDPYGKPGICGMCEALMIKSLSPDAQSSVDPHHADVHPLVLLGWTTFAAEDHLGQEQLEKKDIDRTEHPTSKKQKTCALN